MKNSISNLLPDQQFKEGALTVTIEDNVLIVEELFYPTDYFELVSTAPVGYEVWNIGKHMPRGFVPYAKVDCFRNVDRKTVKATFIGGVDHVLTF